MALALCDLTLRNGSVQSERGGISMSTQSRPVRYSPSRVQAPQWIAPSVGNTVGYTS